MGCPPLVAIVALSSRSFFVDWDRLLVRLGLVQLLDMAVWLGLVPGVCLCCGTSPPGGSCGCWPELC